MRVEEVMTREVLTVDVDTSLKEVAALLAERRISGVVVLDSGRVAGVVSEADILEKETAETPRGAKARAHTAGTAMTSPAITIAPDRPLAEAARTMIDKRVNRLPVADSSGGLAGIVTRADLVRAFLRSDEEIERELREDVALKTLWIDPATLEITVERGEVVLAGQVESKADAKLLERFANRIPGVVGVLSNLHWQVDNPKLPAGNPRVPAPPRR